MATLAKQPIPDEVKKALEEQAEKSGNSIASIVRDILTDRLQPTAGKVIENEVV